MSTKPPPSTYTNSSNPFNDAKLDSVFVWERRFPAETSRHDVKQAMKQQREENLLEIQASAYRREQRELEQKMREEEKQRAQRTRESREMLGWEQREEDFMLKQFRQASILRINQGRENVIDTLARNVLLIKHLRGGEFGPDGKPMISLIDAVGVQTQDPSEIIDTVPITPQLEEDLSKYKRLEGPLTTGEFVAFWDCLLVLCKDRRMTTEDDEFGPEMRQAIRESCQGRKLQDISTELETSRAKAVASVGIPKDQWYWNQVVARLEVERARAYVSQAHQGMVATIRKAARDVHLVVPDAGATGSSSAQDDHDMTNDFDDEDMAFEQLMNLPSDSTTSKSGQIIPRVWNRVRTGVEWNKYTRTHFDSEHPPPRTVFGYKFNVFYGRELKTTPSFTVTSTDSPDFCILTFKAQPPYATISYRILNRPWDRSHNSGYKNVFQNGVLQLHFNFVRRRYRR